MVLVTVPGQVPEVVNVIVAVPVEFTVKLQDEGFTQLNVMIPEGETVKVP